MTWFFTCAAFDESSPLSMWPLPPPHQFWVSTHTGVLCPGKSVLTGILLT